MPPQQQPTLAPSRVEAAQIVTLTVYSSGSPQTALPAPSDGGPSVPVAPIVGGVVGGVTLAVLLVIVWNYWGRTIKRTERKRRKEMQDMLTIRENTRRNATSGFRPQSQYRPMFELNRESRRVTFLAGTPTLQLRASTDNDNDNANAGPLALAQTEGENGQNENAHEEAAPSGSGVIRSMDEIRQLSPNFASSATHLLVGEAPPVPAGAAAAAGGSERKSESGVRPSLEKVLEARMSTEPSVSPPPPPPPPPSPPPRESTPSPPPVPSSSTHTSPKRDSSPTPRPSRSVRMRTPKRLPDPPAAPLYVARDHARPSSPEPRPSLETSQPSLPRSSSINSSRTYRTFDSGMRSTSPTPLLPPVPPVPVLPVSTIPPAAAGPSASSSRSPLRNSVLPSDNPVVLPRPKNAPASVPIADSPQASTPGHLPSLSGSTSQGGQTSRASQSRFLGSLRRGKGKSLTGAAGVRPISALSEASVYSNND